MLFKDASAGGGMGGDMKEDVEQRRKMWMYYGSSSRQYII